MAVTKWRKKPVEIEAWQLNAENIEAVASWCSGSWSPTGHVAIETLEGVMLATPGDFIIRGVQGEFYPCKPDIFAATYERVS